MPVGIVAVRRICKIIKLVGCKVIGGNHEERDNR